MFVCLAFLARQVQPGARAAKDEIDRLRLELAPFEQGLVESHSDRCMFYMRECKKKTGRLIGKLTLHIDDEGATGAPWVIDEGDGRAIRRVEDPEGQLSPYWS